MMVSIKDVTVRRIKHPTSSNRAAFTGLVQIEGAWDGRSIFGSAEIRASEREYHEDLGSACDLVRKCAPVLIGNKLEFPLGSEIKEAAALLTSVTKTALRLGDVPLGRFVHRPSRFALEVALLDLLSQARAMPLAELIGGVDPEASMRVRRNIEKVATKAPRDLYGDLRRKNMHGKWLKLSTPGRPDDALARVQAIRDAGVASGYPPEGIWLNLVGTWHPHETATFLDGYIARFGASQAVPLMLQDPFVRVGDELQWLVNRAAALREDAGYDVRVMIAKPVWDLQSLNDVSEMLAHADLAICPQRAGGVAEVMDIVARYRQLNSSGRIMLYTLGRNTELNTVALAHLAAAIPEAIYFAAKLRRASVRSELQPRPRISEDGGFNFFSRPGLGCSPVASNSVSEAVA